MKMLEAAISRRHIVRKNKSLALLASAAALAAAGQANAALVINTANTPVTIDTSSAALAGNTWTTGSSAGAAADVSTDATVDTRVQTLTNATFATALISRADYASSNALGFYNSTSTRIFTYPTGDALNGVLATVTNNTGQTITSATVNWGIFNPGTSSATQAEEIPGHRVYFSTTGAASSWTAVGDFGAHVNGTALPQNTTVPFNFTTPTISVANGGTLYLLWVDDNAAASSGTGETLNAFDTTTVQLNAVPEPASLGLMGVAGLGLLARRRRQS